VGLSFDVLSVEIDETPLRDEDAVAAARRLATEKARAASRAIAPARRPVLAADTVVTIEGRLLGKPAGPAEARSMLARLSGRWHRVVTGVALHAPGEERVDHASTAVLFAALEEDEIARYVASPEPYDKAGGYALQGAGGWFVREVRGSVSNVIGLPLDTVRVLFRDAGLAGPALGASRSR
jgi:septum formation protein